MRPQHITAENGAGHLNEITAATDASMRPQHITAENPLLWWGSAAGENRFNEAAAYHCGKPFRSAGPESETLSPLQ